MNLPRVIDRLIWEEWYTGQAYKDVGDYLKGLEIYICVDIGAAIGVATSWMLDFLSPDIVFSFEPDKDNYLYLSENFKDNPKVVLNNVGIFYGATESSVVGVGDSNPLGLMSSAIGSEHSDFWKNSLYVYMDKTFKLAELERFVNPADLIKIDVEGSEYNIIENSWTVKHAKWILLETHNHDMEYVINFLSKNLPEHKIMLNWGSGIHLGFLLERAE
jgi:FkbM family methyltransferase